MKNPNRIALTILDAEITRYVSFQDIYGRTYETPVWRLIAIRGEFATEGNGEYFDWVTDQDVRPGMVIRATTKWEGLFVTGITRGKVIGQLE